MTIGIWSWYEKAPGCIAVQSGQWTRANRWEKTYAPSATWEKMILIKRADICLENPIFVFNPRIRIYLPPIMVQTCQIQIFCPFPLMTGPWNEYIFNIYIMYEHCNLRGGETPMSLGNTFSQDVPIGCPGTSSLDVLGHPYVMSWDISMWHSQWLLNHNRS